MSNLRVKLSKHNMDKIMDYVRSMQKNPSEVINYLLDNPELLISAESRLDGKGKEKV